jgi:hypothetical protein
MQVVHARCCGVDIHKKPVVACVLLTSANGHVQREVRTYATMTADLLARSDWLAAYAVTQIAMESTGVFWRPVFHLLEDETRTLVLANPQHIKAVPGRKTDVKDSAWLAVLVPHGLVQPSFIPPRLSASYVSSRAIAKHSCSSARKRSIAYKRCSRAGNAGLTLPW